MAEFVTGKRLCDEVYDIIYNASSTLLILSPYIKLDDYFKKEVFLKHKQNPDLHIFIVFGKNEDNPQRSFSKQDFDYFKDFPNISVVYVPNLHAKYYANESKGIVTSMNLYDHSFKHNVEYGILSVNSILGASKLERSVWEETMELIKKSAVIFVRRPVYKKKILFGRDFMSSQILHDATDDLLKGKVLKNVNAFNFENESYITSEKMGDRVSREDFDLKNSKKDSVVAKPVQKAKGKLVSGTVLGRSKKVTLHDVLVKMESMGYIDNKKKITAKGKDAGLQKKYADNGESWIVYPERMAEML